MLFKDRHDETSVPLSYGVRTGRQYLLCSVLSPQEAENHVSCPVVYLTQRSVSCLLSPPFPILPTFCPVPPFYVTLPSALSEWASCPSLSTLVLSCHLFRPVAFSENVFKVLTRIFHLTKTF